MPLTCVYVSFFSVSDGNSCAHLLLARRRSYLLTAWATFRLARTIFQGLLTLSRQATDSGDVSMGTQPAPEVGDNSRDTELTAERPRGHRDTACTGATIKSTCVSSNFDKRCLSASLLHMYYCICTLRGTDAPVQRTAVKSSRCCRTIHCTSLA